MASPKARIAVLVSGNGSNLQAILDAIAQGTISHGEVVLVVSSNHSAYGLERAQQAGVQTAVLRSRDFSARDDFDEALSSLLDQHGVDLIVLAGYMSILSEGFVKRYPQRIINIHPSLIPAFAGEGFYGLKVHEAALAAGVKVSGATVHYVNEVCDGGEILEQQTVRVLSGDTAQDLQQRVLTQVEHVIYPRVIEQLSKEIVGNHHDS